MDVEDCRWCYTLYNLDNAQVYAGAFSIKSVQPAIFDPALIAPDSLARRYNARCSFLYSVKRESGSSRHSKSAESLCRLGLEFGSTCSACLDREGVCYGHHLVIAVYKMIYVKHLSDAIINQYASLC